MPIYLLEPRDEYLDRWPKLDSVLGAVVVADTTEQARQLLAAEHKDESPHLWLDINYSTCTPIDLVTPRVVLTHANGF